MIPQLMKAMTKVIRELYPDYPIYYDYPERDLDPPCFIIRTTGGNMRRRIKNDRYIRGLSYERFTIEFYSLDMLEVNQVGYELRVLLDVIEIDNGEKYRCYNKNVSTSIAEHHMSMTFNILTEPYIDGEPLPRMMDLELDQRLIKE